MSGKLDQSLDQIMKDGKPAGGRVRGRGRPAPRRAANKAKAAIAAPTGGIQKSTRARPTKGTAAAAAPPAPPASGESKIIVSNLPEDVSEQQIKVR